MPNFLKQAEELFEFTQSMRRDLHMHPELGFTEVRTAGIVAKELSVLDMEVTTGIAKTGVVGMLEADARNEIASSGLEVGEITL